MKSKFSEYIKEEINTVKSSEMDNWSVKKEIDNSRYSGSKQFNFELGQRVLDLLEENGLTVTSCEKNDWLNKHNLLLAPEKSFIEYRVHLGKIKPFDEYLEWEGIENFDNLSKKKQKEIEVDYERGKIDDDGYMEFSVFLPLSIKTNLIQAALSDASTYLKILNETFPDVIRGNIDDAFFDYTEETIKFINKKEIKIKNTNLKDVVTINNRLHKDSSFFGQVQYLFDDHFCKELFNAWLDLL